MNESENSMTSTLSEIKNGTVEALSYLADCYVDGDAARDFLTGIRDAFVEGYEWAVENDQAGLFIEDYAGELTEIAEASVPVYNHDLFKVMVETRAWAEDISEYGEVGDLLQATRVAVYMVADRLVHALANELREDV
jgi:hypothetical protein